MNENAKKAGLVVVVILAIGAAVFGAMRLFGEEKMEIQNTVKMPEGHKSEKQKALEAQGAGNPAPATGKEVDLSGSLNGG